MLTEKEIEVINQIIAKGNTAEIRKSRDKVLIFEVKKQARVNS